MKQPMNVMTIEELIAVLQQQQRVLGPDYLPRILALREDQEPEEYLIEEVATVDGAEQIVRLYAIPSSRVDIPAEEAALAADREED